MADEAIKGAKELYATMQTLPIKLERKLLGGSLRGAMRDVVLPPARAGVSSVSGQLAAGLKVGMRRRKGFVIARIVATGPHGFVAPFVEYGTRPHWISVDDRNKAINVRATGRAGRIVRESMTTFNRRMRSLTIRQRFVGPTVWHPGARAKPFLRPPLDSSPMALLRYVANDLKARLTKAGLMGPDESEVEV